MSGTRLVLRTRWFSFRVARRGALVTALLVLVAVAVALVSLGTGELAIPVPQVIEALTGHESGITATVVLDWRLPRVLLAGAFGVALGLAGAIFQTLTRNPLGSPDVIGFDTGAYTGALVVTLGLHATGPWSTTVGAIVGGLGTAAVVYAVAARRGVNGFRLIVVGIGVTAMLGSVNTWLLLHADTQDAISASFWGAGSLDAAADPQVLVALVVLGVLVAATAALARSMRTLELGDDACRQLGVDADRTRLLLVVVGVGLSATVTALAGPIAFVALAAPQIARRLARSAGVTLGASAATGAALLLASDWIAQHALPQTVPVGLVTVVLGGGYFVWLLIAEGRRR